jgi:hypothetical protein
MDPGCYSLKKIVIPVEGDGKHECFFQEKKTIPSVAHIMMSFVFSASF